MVRPLAAGAAAMEGHSGRGEGAPGHSRRALASQQVLPPLVQVVQLLVISGAEEAQGQLANQKRCGAAWTSAASAWLSWAEAAPLLATAAAPKVVLLNLRSALRLRLELS